MVRYIDIGALTDVVLGNYNATFNRRMIVDFKEEGYKIPFLVLPEGFDEEKYEMRFSPRKKEGKGVRIPSNFNISNLERELLSLQPEVGSSPYGKVNSVDVPLAVVKKGRDDFTFGVLHYVLPEYTIEGEETGNYGVGVVAGYLSGNVFMPLKYLSLPTNAGKVIVTPYGLEREDEEFYKQFVEKVIGKKYLDGKVRTNSLFEELLNEYGPNENKEPIQPSLF